MRAASKSVATAKPTRNRSQPSSKPPTPAQIQRHRDQLAREKTQKLQHQMYERTLHQTKLALAHQKGYGAADPEFESWLVELWKQK